MSLDSHQAILIQQNGPLVLKDLLEILLLIRIVPPKRILIPPFGPNHEDIEGTIATMKDPL